MWWPWFVVRCGRSVTHCCQRVPHPVHAGARACMCVCVRATYECTAHAVYMHAAPAPPPPTRAVRPGVVEVLCVCMYVCEYICERVVGRRVGEGVRVKDALRVHRAREGRRRTRFHVSPPVLFPHSLTLSLSLSLSARRLCRCLFALPTAARPCNNSPHPATPRPTVASSTTAWPQNYLGYFWWEVKKSILYCKLCV